ncbi:MAG: glycosyltransferase family 39 protein [Saprospiraceae bacterium]|nr:glycosyltransferase family 39 protein [Saprospiraceae bacterium]
MRQTLTRLVRDPWAWLGLGLFAVYLRGLFLDVMDVDASQYASISMEMLQTGNWLEVQHRHADYLDKPPLLFWTSALSFALFGLHNWAYKLPSLFGILAGVYATYRFCLLFYPKETARFAAFILAACMGVLLMGNDVRTDTLLMGMTACAVWRVAVLYRAARPGFAEVLWAGFFVGLAMLAKGPIGLIMPVFAVGTHLALRRDWARLVEWRWLLALTVAAVVLIPMCWGLYHQFDLHPEKTVNGRTGVSGLYFYFWEQSFGRITGENVWKNDTSPFYFLHVYLWAFLPWPLLLIGAFGRRMTDLFQQKMRLLPGDEAFSIGAFLLTFVALSMSKYKLPHYIFVTLPWAAVLVARWLAGAYCRTPFGAHESGATTRVAPTEQVQPGKTVGATLVVAPLVVVLLLAASALLLAFVFPTMSVWKWATFLALFGVAAVFLWKKTPERLVQSGVLAFLGTAFVVNFHFYPNLLPYQSTASAPRFAREHGIPAERMGFFNRHGHALDFYAGHILTQIDSPEQARRTAAETGDFWLYTDSTGRARLDSASVRYNPVATFGHFQVALLKPEFLSPSKRDKTLTPVYLLKIEPQ